MDYTCYPKLKRYTKKAVAISSGNRSWTWVLKLDSFIPGRNAIQPLWNTRDLFHTFSDFKKVSDKVWQTRLCVVRDAKLQYTESLDRLVMETLHKTSKSAQLLNNQPREFFQTTVRVRLCCSTAPLETSWEKTLTTTTPPFSCRQDLCNLRFADDIDLVAGSNSKVRGLTKNNNLRTMGTANQRSI